MHISKNSRTFAAQNFKTYTIRILFRCVNIQEGNAKANSSFSPLKGEYPKSPFKGDLEGLFDSPFMAHSDGEKQRILIAKALAQQTPIILLDEPTAHLDLPNRIRLLQLLRSLAHNEGKTILISTHELDLAVKMSDRILLMTPTPCTQSSCPQGIQLATPQELIATDAFTQAFGINPFDLSFEEK